MAQRDPPSIVDAPNPPQNKEQAAASIFIHGLGDDSRTFQAVAQQFINHDKLPHMRWVIPNALENRDAMETAWYTPTSLSPFPSARPELDDPEDEEGMTQSRKYIESLIDDLVAEGIPANRIVVGGFSQGCAMALFLGLTSPKYAGKLGGIFGIAGYLPLVDRIDELRRENGLAEKVDDNVPFIIMRGNKDVLIPRRFLSIAQAKLFELGVKGSSMEFREYEGVTHALTGQIIRDLCSFLEKALPPP